MSLSPTLTPLDVDKSNGYNFALKVLNNEVATWDQIISVLMRATKCEEEEAHTETWEIHNFGSCLVHFGSKESLEGMADIIRTHAECEIIEDPISL